MLKHGNTLKTLTVSAFSAQQKDMKIIKTNVDEKVKLLTFVSTFANIF